MEARTSNTLRLWCERPGLLRVSGLQSRDFVGAVAETLTAETLTRVLYRRLHDLGQGLRFVQNIFSWAARLPISYGAFRRGNTMNALPEQVASSSTIRTRHWRSPS